jgi:hypothetical protein
MMASGSNTVVKQKKDGYKFIGPNLGTTGTGRKKIVKNYHLKFLQKMPGIISRISSSDSAVVEDSTHDS